MFYLQKISRIIIIVALCALTLHWQCLAQAKSVENWGADDSNAFFFTTARRPYIWERYTLPTREPELYNYNDDYGTRDRTVFFVVLFFGICFIVTLLFVCWRSSRKPENVPPSVTTVPTAQGINNNAHFMTVTAESDNNDVDSLDSPPDYATVILSDFQVQSSTQEPAFRQVLTKPIETPPPKYEDNPPFK